MKACESVKVPSHSQTRVSVTAKRRGLVVIRPHSRLYANQLKAFTNVVSTIEPNQPFRVLVANFGDVPKRTVRGQSFPTVIPHSAFVVPTHVTTSNFVGMTLDPDPAYHINNTNVEKDRSDS